MQYKLLFLALGLFAFIVAAAPSSTDDISKRKTASALSIRDVDHTLELVVTTAGNIIIAAINATGIIVKILGEVKSVTEHVADTVAALIEFLEAEPLKTLIQLSNGGVGYVGTAGAIIQSLRAFVP